MQDYNLGPSVSIGAVGDKYDSTATYAVGDYCIYDDKLYKCNTAISTAEAWNASHWTDTTIAEVLQTIPVVVDNLTTNDGTKALSAAQGKALNSKFTTIVTSGSMHDLAGQNGLFWLTSYVTDKPTPSGGLFILRSYDAHYCTGEYIDVDSGNMYSITYMGDTWVSRRYNMYTGIKTITKIDGTYTTGATGNIAIGTSASTGKKVVIGAICTSMDAYCRAWYATSNSGWYITVVNPNTGATVNNTQVTLTYWVIDTD